MSEDNRLKHYILVEVRENENRKRGTDAGDIRKVIHEYAKERGFNTASMVFRPDQERVPFLALRSPYYHVRKIFDNPELVVKPYQQIRNMFETITNEYKRVGLFKKKEAHDD